MYIEPTRDIISIEELCEALSIGKNTAYSLLNSKEIAAFRIGRSWKIPKESVSEYINKKCNYVNT